MPIRSSFAFPDPRTVLAAAATLAAIAAIAVVQSQGPLRVAGERQSLDAYQKLPLSFVPNVGQTDRRARYYAQGNGFSAYFTPDRVVLSFIKGKREAAL